MGTLGRTDLAKPADLTEPRVMAEARVLGYRALARLVAEGVTAQTEPAANASARLRQVLDDHDVETIAADHCHVFDIVAPPLLGLVTDPEARVGNMAGIQVQRTAAAVALDLEPGIELEHLSTLLVMMARLTMREASHAPQSAAHAGAQRDSARMLDRHLLSWLLPYEAAVARTQRAFPAALLAEIVDLSLHHRNELAMANNAIATADSSCQPMDLDAADTDLRAIAKFLLCPAASGLLLTRSDLTSIGRGVRVPRGFGDRSVMLFNLLRNAAELGELVAVARGLKDLARSQTDHMAARLAHVEPLAALLVPWQARLTTTVALLDRISEEAARVTVSEPPRQHSETG